MAASGYTPIQLYYSATTTNVPLAANLAAGELAINTADGKLFYKDSSGTVQTIASKATGAIAGSNTQVIYNSSGAYAGSANLTFNGTTLTSTGFSGPLNGTVGASTPAAGAFTTLSYSSTLTGGTGVVNLGSGQFYKDASGNVGFGTASPSTFRGANSGANSQVLVISTTATLAGEATYSGYGTTVSGALNLYQNSGNSFLRYFDIGVFGDANVGGAGSLIRFLTQSTGVSSLTERMRIDSSGNVGIGGASGGSKLYVTQDQAAYSYFDFSNATNGGGIVWRQIHRDLANTTTSSVDLAWLTSGGFTIANNDTGAANFTSFSVGGTERMRINSSGNVMIGTTTPNGRLHISDPTAASMYFTDSGAATTHQIVADGEDFGIRANGAYSAVVGVLGGATQVVYFRTSNAERARISATGGFSVGTTSDPGAGAIYATGNITAFFSDDRLKTRHGKIENALDKLHTLDGFYYTPNQVAQDLGYEAVQDVGVSAQAVQAILPEVVAPAPIDDKYLTVRYEKLVPLLIEAIKELTAKVEALEAK